MSLSLCADDVVARTSNPTVLGVVERTHDNIDTHEPYPGDEYGAIRLIQCDPDIPKAAFRKFEKDGVPPKGTVLVQWQMFPDFDLIPESKLQLIDRSLLVGDVVKRNVRDAMSGVIINTFTVCTLHPLPTFMLSDSNWTSTSATLNGCLPPLGLHRYITRTVHEPEPVIDVPASELQSTESLTPDDIVIYKGWLGRVLDTESMVALKLPDNGVVEISEDVLDGEDHDSGVDVGELAATKKPHLRTGNWIYGKYNPNTMPVGVVVQIRNVLARIVWLERRIDGGKGDELEPPSVLERPELESPDFCVYDRSKRPARQRGSVDSTTLSNSDIDLRLNQRVRFKDLAGACVKYDGSNGKGKVVRTDRRDTLGYDMNVWDVGKFQTDVLVQWQDLSMTRERGVDVVPDLAIDDEHNTWPAEIVHPPDLEPVSGLPYVKQAKKVGIVQSVNATERMAKVRWCPNACVQYNESEADSSASRSAVMGVVGLAGGELEELSLYELEAPAELNVRRGDIVLLAKPRLTSTDGNNDDANDKNWLGEIVDTKLDGSFTIRLGAANSVQDVTLRREDFIVAIRSDGTDIGPFDDDDELLDARLNSDGELEMIAGSDADSDMSLDYESESEEANVRYEDENGEVMDVLDVEDDEWESESEGGDVDMADTKEETPLTSQSDTPPPISNPTRPTKESHTTSNAKDSLDEQLPPAYAILSTPVPSTHAFSTDPVPTSPVHTKRTAKEHQILRKPSNLPAGVYVRTWEARMDLLRVLFIGPAGTPYVHAPFIMDISLPASFPTEPPKAYFHSWRTDSALGGVGRLNPNLYEDGKICLSLLGTWESGGKGASDGWSAARSTLLQVLVSLLGLVLVSEPYFNEAGYEGLVGLESSRRASEVYSERVFLRARMFIVAALSGRAGVEGFEDTLGAVYREGKLLEKVVADAEVLLKGSDCEAAMRDAALPVLSKGACISLSKILEKLKEL